MAGGGCHESLGFWMGGKGGGCILPILPSSKVQDRERERISGKIRKFAHANLNLKMNRPKKEERKEKPSSPSIAVPKMEGRALYFVRSYKINLHSDAISEDVLCR